MFRREGNEIYYLLLHYQPGHWDFPKGHIEAGESEEETVKREIAEETGIKDIVIIKGFREQIKYFFRDTYDRKKNASPASSASRSDAGRWIFKVVTFYLAETATKGVKISFEHKGFKWLPYKEAMEQLTFKNAKNILTKAHDCIISQ